MSFKIWGAAYMRYSSLGNQLPDHWLRVNQVLTSYRWLRYDNIFVWFYIWTIYGTVYGPYYGQPEIIHFYDQTIVNLESYIIYYGRLWSAWVCVGGKPGNVRSRFQHVFTSNLKKVKVTKNNSQITEAIFMAAQTRDTQETFVKRVSPEPEVMSC